MNSAEEIRVPQRIPQVSRLEFVLVWARLRNVRRRAEGRKSGRRGEPASVVALGWKMYFDDGAGGAAGGGEGDNWDLRGRAGSSWAVGRGSKDSLAGRMGASRGVFVGLLGCRGCIVQSIVPSLAGTAGYR